MSHFASDVDGCLAPGLGQLRFAGNLDEVAVDADDLRGFHRAFEKQNVAKRGFCSISQPEYSIDPGPTPVGQERSERQFIDLRKGQHHLLGRFETGDDLLPDNRPGNIIGKDRFKVLEVLLGDGHDEIPQDFLAWGIPAVRFFMNGNHGPSVLMAQPPDRHRTIDPCPSESALRPQ